MRYKLTCGTSSESDPKAVAALVRGARQIIGGLQGCPGSLTFRRDDCAGRWELLVGDFRFAFSQLDDAAELIQSAADLSGGEFSRFCSRLQGWGLCTAYRLA